MLILQEEARQGAPRQALALPQGLAQKILLFLLLLLLSQGFHIRSKKAGSTCVHIQYSNCKTLLSKSNKIYISNGHPTRPEHVFENSNGINISCLLFLKHLSITSQSHLPNIFDPEGVALRQFILGDATESLYFRVFFCQLGRYCLQLIFRCCWVDIMSASSKLNCRSNTFSKFAFLWVQVSRVDSQLNSGTFGSS